MLLSSFFILDFEKFEGSLDVDLPDNAYVCYRISHMLSGDTNPVNRKLLSSYKKNQFCLLVDVDKIGAEFEKVIHSIVPYTFFYNYLKFNFENPLLIFESEQPGADAYIIKAKEIFKRHGYNDIDTVRLNKASVLSNNSAANIIVEVKKNDNFSNEYAEVIRQISSAYSLLFFLPNDSRELAEMIRNIEQSELQIRQQSPQTYNLLDERRMIRKNEQEMRSAIGLQQEQLDSITNYHLYYNASDNRYKRQIKELLGFYQNEYEILPKWYKRAGHVLKVMMGKRTFKSLFNDNVKKYNV